MKTIVDLSERPPFAYQREPKQIGEIPMTRKLAIAFDLEMQPKPESRRNFREIPLLQFEGKESLFTVSVNDWRGFGITQYQRDPWALGKKWIHLDSIRMPQGDFGSSMPTFAIPHIHYHIQILARMKLSVSVNDGQAAVQWLRRALCRKGEIMQLSFPKGECSWNGTAMTIHNLLVTKDCY